MSRTLLCVAVLGAGLALLAAPQGARQAPVRRRRPAKAAAACPVAGPAAARAAREEEDRFTAALQPYLKDHEQTVALSEGTLAPASAASPSQPAAEFLAPVDSSIGSIVFSVFLECPGEILIDRPDGALLRSPEAGVEDHALRHGRIVTAAHPITGLWRIRISGRGRFAARADAQSSLFASRAEFVQPRGQPGQESYSPIQMAPRMGVPELLEVRLAGPVGTARFGLVPPEGGMLQTFNLPQVESSGDEKVFRGPATANLETFRLLVEGEDAHGFPYQRLYSRLFRTRPASQ
ncbi:MAG TPA: hypothetical protein VEU62_20290 [Bryobacterales bacterium]|nr:hypothetical protein [Bryobacterales bacterium]